MFFLLWFRKGLSSGMNRRYADKEMCWKKPKEKTYWHDIVQNYVLYKNYVNFFIYS